MFISTYHVAFSLEGLDEEGQEHRIVTQATSLIGQPDTRLAQAARNVVSYAARILGVEPDVAATKVRLRSAWYDGGRKKRVTPELRREIRSQFGTKPPLQRPARKPAPIRLKRRPR